LSSFSFRVLDPPFIWFFFFFRLSPFFPTSLLPFRRPNPLYKEKVFFPFLIQKPFSFSLLVGMHLSFCLPLRRSSPLPSAGYPFSFPPFYVIVGGSPDFPLEFLKETPFFSLMCRCFCRFFFSKPSFFFDQVPLVFLLPFEYPLP